MKIAITADTHLNNGVYGVRDSESGMMIKTIDAFRALDFFIAECISRKVDRAVFDGDIYDNHYPTSDIRRMFAERVQQLVREGIQTVIVVGNHDSCGDHHAQLPLKGWSNIVKVVDTPIVEKAAEYTAIYVPHTKEVEKGQKKFPELVRSVVAEDCNKPVIFFGHFSVNGAASNDYGVHSSRTDVSVDDIVSTGADIAFLGHFHKHQTIEADIPISYVGSLERHNLSELNGDRGFDIYDTTSRETERVPYPDARPMERLPTCTFAEALGDIDDRDDWEGYVLAFDFEGDERGYVEMKARISELRALFKSRGGCHLLVYDKRVETDSEDGESDKKRETVDQVDLLLLLRQRIATDWDGDDAEITAHEALLDEIWKEAEVIV